MRCSKCGKKMRNGQTVCPWCGASTELTATEKPTKRRRKWLIGIAITFGTVLLALLVAVVSIGASLFGKINRESDLNVSEIAVNSALPPAQDVQNILLLGLDSRSDDESGHSDAIIILTIDRVHNKIKLTTLARDSFLPVEGYGYKKLTDCFASGKVQLTVKTINQNFAMNITDYAYVNFYEFVELIDYIGGVEIDVDQNEMRVMNNKYIPELNALGISCDKVASVGVQRLSGGQALAYARDRYSGGTEFARGNRHKEVLEAMFGQMKDTSTSKMLGVINKVLPMCHTNLTNDEMLSIGTWALTSTPTFEQLSLPSTECHIEMGDRGDGYGDVVRFDIGIAADVLHEFIYETEKEENTQSIE